METDKKNALPIIIVIIVVAAALAFWYFSEKKTGEESINSTAQVTTGVPAAPDADTVAKNKADILAQTKSGQPLTPAQREQIFAVLSGENISYYNFTEAEKKQIVDALNAR